MVHVCCATNDLRISTFRDDRAYTSSGYGVVDAVREPDIHFPHRTIFFVEIGSWFWFANANDHDWNKKCCEHSKSKLKQTKHGASNAVHPLNCDPMRSTILFSSHWPLMANECINVLRHPIRSMNRFTENFLNNSIKTEIKIN